MTKISGITLAKFGLAAGLAIAQIAVAVVYSQDFVGFPANAESATRVTDVGRKTQ
jgi:hypothetical protein